MNQKDKFLNFLKSKKLLAAYKRNYKMHQFKMDASVNQFLNRAQPTDYIRSAFIWNRTMEGFNFWLDLSNEWLKFIKQ